MHLSTQLEYPSTATRKLLRHWIELLENQVKTDPQALLEHFNNGVDRTWANRLVPDVNKKKNQETRKIRGAPFRLQTIKVFPISRALRCAWLNCWRLCTEDARHAKPRIVANEILVCYTKALLYQWSVTIALKYKKINMPRNTRRRSF